MIVYLIRNAVMLFASVVIRFLMVKPTLTVLFMATGPLVLSILLSYTALVETYRI